MTFAIIGPGGHAKSIYDIIKNRAESLFLIIKKNFEVGKKKNILILKT